jgi:transposase
MPARKSLGRPRGTDWRAVVEAILSMARIVRRLADTVGFEILPRRWVVDRTLAWLNRYRRLAEDFQASIRQRPGLALCRFRAATHQAYRVRINQPIRLRFGR